MALPSSLSLRAEVDTTELFASIMEDHNFDILGFILRLEEEVSDEGFTVELVKSLVQVLLNDYHTELESATKANLEAALDPDVAAQYRIFADRSLSKWEWPPTTTKTSYVAELPNMQKAAQRVSACEQIIALLNTIFEPDD